MDTKKITELHKQLSVKDRNLYGIFVTAHNLAEQTYKLMTAKGQSIVDQIIMEAAKKD